MENYVDAHIISIAGCEAMNASRHTTGKQAAHS